MTSTLTEPPFRVDAADAAEASPAGGNRGPRDHFRVARRGAAPLRGD